MKYFQKIMASAIAGVIVGAVFLLPFLGWIYAGHGLISLYWTRPFLIVGIVWGLVCGISIGLVSIMINSSTQCRLVLGMIIGGISGIVFYIIGDLAFLTDDSLTVVIFKSLWGLFLGIFDGGISALVLGELYRMFKWIRVEDEISNETNQGKKYRHKEKTLNSLIGLNIGAMSGGFLLLIIGQAKLVIYGFLYFNEILLFYLLPIIFGCLAALYVNIRPIQKLLLIREVDGLRNGIIFSMVSIVFFTIMVSTNLLTPFPKPEFIKNDLFLPLVLIFFGVFTIGFGLVSGVVGVAFEIVFMKWKARTNNIR